MASLKFIDRNKGYRRLLREVRKARSKPHVAIGIHGDKGESVYDSGETVAKVAAKHEFGLDGMPERSFLRGTVDLQIHEIRDRQRRLMDSVVAGRTDTRTALERLGLSIKGYIQKRMAQGIPPPNSQETVDRKGSSTPLIDTGQLRKSIDFEVRGV